MRIIVIGGDAAGMSAASRARKERPDSEVVVYEAGNYVSYSACGIPFHVGGEVENFNSLLHYPVSKFVKERHIEVKVNSRVTKILPSEKKIVVETGGETITQIYDRLIIATGARPRIPDTFQGKKKVYTLRTLDDMNSLLINAPDGGDVAIVGGGYVGVEMAEAFTSRGMHVTLLQRSGRLLRGLDEEFSDIIKEELVRNGVELHLNSPVEEADDSVDGKITLKSGSMRVTADLVLLAAGVVPNSEIAKEAGIELDGSGAIRVDEKMQTSAKGVYAAGDVATTSDLITGKRVYFPLATGSNRSGRIAGYNAAGGEMKYKGITRTEVVKVFSVAIGRTGLDENEARLSGFDPVASAITASSRASYYPGSEDLRIKLTADRNTHRVLGAILAGKDGVAKRIDVVATALYSGLTVEDMTSIDYSYSPPFAPAWEPLGVAADVLLKKLT